MFDFEFIRDNWLFIAAGVGETLGVAIVAFSLAIPTAITVARGRRSGPAPVRALSALYVWLVNGTPLLLQIFFIFLALPQLRIFLPGFWAAALVLAANYGSRMSELFHAPFTATGKDRDKTHTSLIAPMTSELTGVIKDSTLIAVTGFLHDVIWRAARVGRPEFHMLEAFSIAAVIYLILFTLISSGGKLLATRWTTAEPGAQAPA